MNIWTSLGNAWLAGRRYAGSRGEGITQMGYGGYTPSERPMISFWISVVPP
jgi:hypothetical protein